MAMTTEAARARRTEAEMGTLTEGATGMPKAMQMVEATGMRSEESPPCSE